jgi:hypothetical protein
LHNKKTPQHFVLWRFLLRSRRAIRSITRFMPSAFCGWFRYYPSRKNAFSQKEVQSFSSHL